MFVSRRSLPDYHNRQSRRQSRAAPDNNTNNNNNSNNMLKTRRSRSWDSAPSARIVSDNSYSSSSSIECCITSPNTICKQRHMSTMLVTCCYSETSNKYASNNRPTKLCSPQSALPRVISTLSSSVVYRQPKSEEANVVSTEAVRKEKIVDYTKLVSHPPCLRREAWKDADATAYKVRAATYLKNAHKAPSQESIFKLFAVDLVKVKDPVWTGLCSHPAERIQQALQREVESGNQHLPTFVFAVNLVIPGETYYHWVAYFGIDDISVIKSNDTPVGRLCQQFFFGNDDSFRNDTFKLIPRIVEGNFIVRKAVGSKPSILGQKLRQTYTRTERFCEVVVDIGSNAIAQRVVQLALGYAKSLTVDLMFLIEAKDVESLPERILGGVQINQIDFAKKDGQRMIV